MLGATFADTRGFKRPRMRDLAAAYFAHLRGLDGRNGSGVAFQGCKFDFERFAIPIDV